MAYGMKKAGKKGTKGCATCPKGGMKKPAAKKKMMAKKKKMM
jgi:hypothetical protein